MSRDLMRSLFCPNWEFVLVLSIFPVGYLPLGQSDNLLLAFSPGTVNSASAIA
ncbi:MAG: hypothetical protein P5678_16535 [Limnospira sp. PMC 1240.20]|uniref:hypothetical protein n=1 Tax=unclassified Limnospira TaxID=2642885 RepID=UPI0028E18146|nr:MULTISPECIES: hypothetical protein [unclassified Limnospira]MDT9177373.1 hypothetical protein [Limnospira sp. PMC 1238.20]MDT9218299.1 hypothetical protein [Limnospira sp. PMC 1240.20]MDT9220162.1 hypothetical protein [Limnospira sp. PMC 1240.20]MDT9233450.1 hypothetical protein [Limnospira sp. PMC 917.15]MDT9235274.1 hypothetical protein [Limnospira sp. PMC 917.15]